MLKPRPTVDTAKIQEAISQELPISITTYTLPHEMELFMSEVLHAFLTQLHQDGITQYLTYCLNELVINAKKANTKRVYFSEKNLDLFNKFLFHSPNPIAYRINLSINSFGAPTASYPGDVF